MQRRLQMAFVLAVWVVFATAPPAFGWGNGPDCGRGFGTHDWVLTEAVRLAGDPKWLKRSVALAASDDPDTAIRDHYFHVYDVWGSSYGDSPKKVASLYVLAARAHRSRNYNAASRYVGLLSHYYSDTCEPLHTDETTAGVLIRLAYEQDVDERTNAVGKNRSWIRADGLRKVTDVAAKTRSAAAFAHRRYWSLVSHYSAAGFDAMVDSVTRATLNRAANDLADIIWSLPGAPAKGGAAVVAPPTSRVPTTATVAGVVRDGCGPVAGAVVRAQATEYVALTDWLGCFSLKLPQDATGTLSAWAPGYFIESGGPIVPGTLGIAVTLRRIAATDDACYRWISVVATGGAGEGSACANCHSAVGTGLDLDLPVDQWRRDAHSRSAVNPRFLTMYAGTDLAGNQSPLTRYVQTRDYGRIPLLPDPTKPYYGPGYRLDFPTTSGNCATCHVPVAALDDPYGIDVREVTGVATEGAACDFCHKVWDVRLDPKTRLPAPGLPGVLSFDIRRPSGGHQLFTGPFDDVAPGDDTYSPLQLRSDFCAPCHRGVFWGVVVYDSYGEWLASPYSHPKTGRTCQDCHMPRTGESCFALPTKGGRLRDPDTLRSHAMPGAADVALLGNAVTMTVAPKRENGEVVIDVSIVNDRTGHHVPTDSPLRQMLLLVKALDATGMPLVQTGGPSLPEWAGVGEPARGYYAGLPGKAYAKVLEELWTRVTPTAAYWKQTRLVSDNRIPAFGRDDTTYRFAEPASGAVRIEVQLLFRRAFRELADQKGWTDEDIMMEEYATTLGP